MPLRTDILTLPYGAVERLYSNGQLESADFARYCAIWFYSAPRLSELVDLPRCREINRLLDGQPTADDVATFAHEWNRLTAPYELKTDGHHQIDRLSARAIRQHLAPFVTEYESGRLVAASTTA